MRTLKVHKNVKPVVRLVSQVVLRLPRNRGISAFEKMRDIALRWIRDRASGQLPDEAWKGQSFNLDTIGARRTEAVAISDPEIRYWRSRLDTDDEKVPSRDWTTEIAIGEVSEDEEQVTTFCVRLQCITRGEDRPFDPSIPSLVQEVMSTQTAYFDKRVKCVASVNPQFIDSEDGIDELCELLTNPDRHWEIIVFSLPEHSTDPNETALLKKDVEDIAKKTAGTAHVAIIAGPASYWLSDRIGKEFSVYQQGVRSYLPGFDPEIDDPFRHPLTLQNRIHERGDEWIEKFLISHALQQSISYRNIEQYLPSFTNLRHLALQSTLRNAENLHKQINELEDNLKAAEELRNEVQGTTSEPAIQSTLRNAENLHKQINELEDNLKAAEELINEAEDENLELLEQLEVLKEETTQETSTLKSRNWNLKNHIKVLEEKGDKSTQPEIPNNLDNFEDWCNENLPVDVVVLNRAFREAKKSQYEDSSLIYKGLLMLSDYYIPMRKEGGEESRKLFKEECEKIGIEESPSGSETRQGEEGEMYFVNYLGRKRLDRHLTKGSSRDPRYCFRLYFFWDDENQEVIVGSLPDHLDTRIS